MQRTSIRVGFAIVTSTSLLIAGGASAASAAPLDGTDATSVARVQQSVEPAARPVATKAASSIVPVWVTLGGRAFVRDAKVEVLNARGKVLQTVRSFSGGVAVFDRNKIAGAKTVRVTGGRSTIGSRNDAVLRAPIQVNPTLIRLSYVSPVSTVATGVAQRLDIAYAKALRKTLVHLEIPLTTDSQDQAIAPIVFNPERFASFAKGRGGVKRALAVLVKEVVTKAPHRSFASRNLTQTRDDVADWAGEMVITSVYQAATGQVPQGTIGNIFGVTDPTTAALGSIESELTTVANELVVVEGEMQEMLDAVETDTYDTLVAAMGDIPGDVKQDWGNYQSVINNDELWDDTTLLDYSNQWIGEYGNSMGVFQDLFTSDGETGILAQLYIMNQAEYPWWDVSVVDNIQGTVDYWGTIQAEASALLSEAWTFESNLFSEQYIQNNVEGDFYPTNGNIYLSMPTTISSDQVVDPATQYMYELVAATATGATASYAGDGQANHNASCSSLGSSHTFSDAVLVSDATVEGWWTSATPSGWTTSTTSPFSVMKESRTLNSVNQNALTVLASGLPSAWAMVTADSVPYLGGWSEEDVVDGHSEGYTYTYTGWLWCGSDTVSLVGLSGSPTQWEDDYMMASGSWVPSGAKVPVNGPVPVGVLVGQPGVFNYVAPPPPPS